MKPESQHRNQGLIFGVQKNLGTELLAASWVLQALNLAHVWVCANRVPRGKLDVPQRTGSPAFRKP